MQSIAETCVRFDAAHLSINLVSEIVVPMFTTLTQMPTLENRRLYLSLCTLYKIIHGHFYFPDNVFISQPSRHFSNLTFVVPTFCSH